MSVERIRSILIEEAEAILAAADRIGQPYSDAIDQILACKGRLITCGVGKSGHVAQKASATFASTGTPSFFLHAAEAVHGDLGMITKDDIVMVYSYSGETDEIVRLFPSFEAIGASTIAVVGRSKSSVATKASLVLDVSVAKEACPHDLAPTTSTTLMLAVSDALAVTLLEQRGFSRADFAKFHPAGSLGRRLTLHVRDVMRKGDELPVVTIDTPLADCLRVVGQKGAGGAVVLSDSKLAGYFTDGDLRRWIMNGGELEVSAGQLATQNPLTISSDMLAFEALEIFQNYPIKIGEIPVVDGSEVVGLLVLKDLVRAGLV